MSIARTPSVPRNGSILKKDRRQARLDLARLPLALLAIALCIKLS
jgi:hypothetical protein